ncbi:MAG TPA: hypothetical protein VF611_05785 [Pyrinomonadaceae bacterium]|jgi:hypothetical protein
MYQNPPYPIQSGDPGFVRHSVVDHQNEGMVVSTFAHPAEWQARSEVMWNMQHTELPALAYAAAYNPRGAECFEFLPTQAFFWLENDYGTVPVGQNAHGLVRMPPRPAPDALAGLVIPAFRRDRVNLRVTGVRPAQNLWQLFNDPPPQNGECVMARAEYEHGSYDIEEEFYGVYSWNSGMQLNWGFGRLFCFRTERGRLDALRETFWRIAGSLQFNPEWGQRYEQIVRQLRAGFDVRISDAYRRLEHEKQMGIANLAHNKQLRDRRSADVDASVERQRQQMQERPRHDYTRQEAFGDMLMNRTPYHDPNSAEGNYRYVEGDPARVQTDGQGNFVASDDPWDDANRSLNGNWVDADRVKPNR